MISYLRSKPVRNFAFFAALAVIAAISALTLISLDKGREQAEMVRHTYLVLKTSQRLQAEIKDANAAHRGFAISGLKEFLEPFATSRDETRKLLNRLSKLTVDNPAQQQRLQKLTRLLEAKYKQIDNSVKLRMNYGQEAALAFIATGSGEVIMDRIRTLAEEFDREEMKLLEIREAEAAKALARIRTVILIGVSLSLTIIILNFIALQKQIRRRRMSERELYNKNQWFTQTLFSLGDGVIATDTEGRITLMNRAACEITKWDEKDSLGKHIDEIVNLTSEISGKKVINPAIDAMQRNEVAFLESSTILERKDGFKIIMDDSGAPIHDRKGNIIGAVLIFRDVTDKRRAEKELSVFHELSKDMIGMVNNSGQFTRINPSFSKTLGYPASDLILHSYLDFVHPEDQAESQSEFRKLLRGMPVENFVNRYRCVDGNFKWLEWNVVALDETVYAAARDITDKHKMTEELRSAYRQFYQILETNPVAILITETETGLIKYVNDAFCSLIGMKPDELVGEVTDTLAIFKAFDCANLRRQIIDSGGRERNFECVFLTKAGEVDVLFSVESLMIDDINCFVSSFVDITERKRSEREVKWLNETLEKRVVERTSELRRQKDFTDDILNKIPIEIAVYDKHGRYLYVNPAGIPDDKIRKWIIGKNDLEYCNKHRINPQISEKRVEAFTQIGKGKQIEWIDEIADDSGSVKYMLRSLNPLKRTKHYILTGIDITELKIAEREKQQYINDLEEMMFITSHKVRHPVAQIVGLRMLLNEDLSHEELKQIISYTADSINSLETFTRELTMFIYDLRKKSSLNKSTD